MLLQKTAELRKASGSHVGALEAHGPLLALASKEGGRTTHPLGSGMPLQLAPAHLHQALGILEPTGLLVPVHIHINM